MVPTTSADPLSFVIDSVRIVYDSISNARDSIWTLNQCIGREKSGSENTPAIVGDPSKGISCEAPYSRMCA